jgi:hypothetical protein
MEDPLPFDPYLDHGHLAASLTEPARRILDAITGCRAEWIDFALQFACTRALGDPAQGDPAVVERWETHLVLTCDLTGDGVPLFRLIGQGRSASAALFDLGQRIEERLLQAGRRSLSSQGLPLSRPDHNRDN